MLQRVKKQCNAKGLICKGFSGKQKKNFRWNLIVEIKVTKYLKCIYAFLFQDITDFFGKLNIATKSLKKKVGC